MPSLPSAIGSALLVGGDVVSWLLGEAGSGGAPAPAPGAEVGVDPATGLSPSLALASLAFTAVIAAGTRYVTRENVLEHDTRHAMYEYIWETGAAHLRSIAETLDLSTTNATWHLDKLEDAGLIGQVKVNGYRMYYPKGGGRLLKQQCKVAGQVQSENARAILDYVCENPGSHQRQIARALDLNHGTARWHLSRFEENGLLESRKEGRTTTYRLSETTERVLSRMPPIAMQQAAPA